MLDKAIAIAIKAHAGQVDEAGDPYIFHPFRVMMSCANEVERICGVLHDTIEDTGITLDYLRQEGFSDEVLDVLGCLAKRPGESYDEFISRVLTNRTASLVKLADLHDNIDLSGLKHITEQDKARMEKCCEAADRIYDALSMYSDIKDERVIEINGCVSVQPYVTHDDFLQKFIGFVEAHGWYFGGGTADVTDKGETED